METADLHGISRALRAAAESVMGEPGHAHEDDVGDGMLVRLMASVVETISRADGAGITQLVKKQVLTRAPSASWVAGLDDLQASLEEGPCIDAARASGPARVDVVDLPTIGYARWPRWAPEAVGAGVTHMLSYAMAPTDAAAASLNVYSLQSEGFTDTDRLTAEVFAFQAAVALYGSDRATGLTRALVSRDVLGQAKGILIERHRVTDDQAFTMLRQASQSANIKVVDVARWLISDAQGARETGDQPHADSS